MEREEVRAVPLYLYSAGRRHIGYADQPWQEEILSGEGVLRADVQHDGHMNVTCLHSEQRNYWKNKKERHVTGLHTVLQQRIVRHETFTECLLLLHERLARTMQEVIQSGKQTNYFDIL